MIDRTNFIIVKYKGGSMSSHGKNMKDIGTTAKLKNVFIIAKWRSFEATKRSGSAWLL